MDPRERGPVNIGRLVERGLFAIFTSTPPNPSVPGLDGFVERVEESRVDEDLFGPGVEDFSDLESKLLDKLGRGVEAEEKKTEVLTRALQHARGYWIGQRNGTPGKEEGLHVISRRLDKLKRPTTRR